MTNTEAVEGRVRQIAPDAVVRSLSKLDRIDYADAFVVDVGAPRSRRAEEWMRVVLEDAPASVRLRLLSAWSAIGLKISLPGSDRSVLGWQIRTSDGDVVLLGADSRVGMPGELLLQRQESGLLFATFVRQDNAIAQALWSSIESAHVRTVRSILEMASRRAAA
ncbi:hypothetical protein [Mycolicibacterium gadium]|uniref:DUF3806 domain-containing protein n=1 Tax=Mycolicibacterium gadium TaxID=1794 RepID=A0ABT6GV01_MYCGU|nr:hypothetical protein [Mycolicibacterium gadium]MDG5485131.1 hypothetical protein [Mycolicibacterium gadium]